MSNTLYKQIRISWEYPKQPTSLQVGHVRIVRSTEPFVVETALAQTQIDYREYDPSFTSFVDTQDLQENTTYYYMIIAYGDVAPDILAATELYSVSIENPEVPSDEIPPNEMHFTTLSGSVDYVGTQGDQILLSDGTIIDVTSTDETFTFDVPSGKHKVKLVESVDRSSYVSLGGDALVELHNFPALSTVTKFNFATYKYNKLSNLTKVPEFFPSNIIDIEYLFYYAANFNQDISMWDVSNVTNMNRMFRNATTFNQDISGWNVSNVTDMSHMFRNAITFNQPLNDWDVSDVIDMSHMFYNATSFDQDIGSWNVSNVTSMSYMFYNCIVFDQDISMWNVSNVTDMESMFHSATAFNQPLNNWNVSNVTYMDDMFRDAITFNQPLNSWDVSNVTEIDSMFYNATAFNQPLNNWNVSNVRLMSYMFYNAIVFDQDISMWNVSNVEYMHSMFQNATAFNQNLSQWCVSKITETPLSFDFGATSWTSPRPVWGTCPRG